MKKRYDVVVIGGGFYGVSIALHLRKYFKNIAVIEAAEDLFTRATYNNQARIHNGYHYPRSPLTALRSHLNFQQFLHDYSNVVDHTFQKLYAVASSNSKVTAQQFYQFMRNIDAPIEEANQDENAYFNSNLVEAVFKVEEVAFNALKLKEKLQKKLQQQDVEVFLNQLVEQVEKDGVLFTVRTASGDEFHSEYVFNCTYASINSLLQRMQLPLLPIKYELTELALVTVPPELKKIGMTLMDGPFFSLMPFPAENLHSLSHVRYTPHFHWSDEEKGRAQKHTTKKTPASQFIYMQKDAQRYCPLIEECQYQKSLFEVKTILMANESDDGRPILFRQHYGDVQNFFVVLGGKIDNIYDIFEKIDGVFNG